MLLKFRTRNKPWLISKKRFNLCNDNIFAVLFSVFKTINEMRILLHFCGSFLFLCSLAILGSPVIVNGDEFENIEIQNVPDAAALEAMQQGGRLLLDPHHESDVNRNVTSKSKKCDIVLTSAPEPGKDVMREMVMNKEVMKSTSKRLDNRFNSMDSEMSEASTLVSTSSENVGEDSRRRSRINHHTIRGTLSDSEMEMSGVSQKLHIYNVF